MINMITVINMTTKTVPTNGAGQLWAIEGQSEQFHGQVDERRNN